MSFQSALARLESDWLARELFLSTGGNIDRIASKIVEQDAFREAATLRKCLELVGCDPSDTKLADWYAHRLWCSYRELLWVTSGDAPSFSIDETSRAAIAETAGRPTILCGAMTVAQSDILYILSNLFPARPMLAYGEGIGDLAAFAAAGDGLAAVRNIHRVLASGGVLVTYADFAYASHSSVPAPFFGTMRPFSSGMLSFALKPNTCILPMVARSDRESNHISIFADEPFAFETTGRSASSLQRATAAQEFAAKLEQLILRCPEQWLLLPTLCFESPQAG